MYTNKLIDWHSSGLTYSMQWPGRCFLCLRQCNLCSVGLGGPRNGNKVRHHLTFSPLTVTGVRQGLVSLCPLSCRSLFVATCALRTRPTSQMGRQVPLPR